MINWLASYPKSGNTWVRLLLDAYIWDRVPDINSINSTRGDQKKKWYNDGSFDIMDYPLEEQLLARGMMLLKMNKAFGDGILANDVNLPLIIKTHCANAIVNQAALIPDVITNRIILVVRDPRDIAPSYANHLGVSLDEVIDIMLEDNSAAHSDSNPDHLPENMMSWKMHTQTYITDKEKKVYVVKYEDLLEDPILNFTWILESFQLPIDKERIKRAVDNCKLSKIKAQEEKDGFRELSNNATTKFFGAKKERLNPEQCKRLEDHAKDMMTGMGYLDKGE